MKFNYQKICRDIVKDLKPRTKEVILRRFALDEKKDKERETLESIGKSFGITRERVRQIEESGFGKISQKSKKYQDVFEYFTKEIKAVGDLRKEDILLSQLGGQQFQPHVFFLLSVGEKFQRFFQTKDYHFFWTINPDSVILAKKIINSLFQYFQKIKKPLSFEGMISSLPSNSTKKELSQGVLESYLEISKTISKGADGLYGPREWPEINPRGVKDKAYFALKKIEKPLHFTKVAGLIEAHIQTVHNELIKDPRFVLVGRGTYALKDWGYMAGTVKDVIFETLKGAKKPLTREEILENVLKQRAVKTATVLLNLQDKNHFIRNSQGKYYITEES